MKDAYSNREIPMFSLEDFMVSISYSPKGMTTNLARKIIQNEKKKLSDLEREQKIFSKALELLPIGLYNDDIFAGNYGEDFTNEDFIKLAKDADDEILNNGEDYRLDTDDEKFISGRYLLFGVYTLAHTCLDYENIIKNGLIDYENRIKSRLKKPIDDYGRAYLNAMLKSIDDVRNFVSRYIHLANIKLNECNSSKRKKELERMIAALNKVPYKPADNFFEALQSIWIMHTTVPIYERSWASISLGRLDKILLPYYEKWLADGGTREECIEFILAFYKLLDSYGDGSCALNFGPDFNALTDVFLEAEKISQRRSPIVAVRIAPETHDSIIDKYIDKTLFNMGQPTFYGEVPCREAMRGRGISDSEDFSINSCMGLHVVGKELSDMWGCCVNMNFPLELAICNGKALHGEIPPMLGKYLEGLKAPAPTSIENIKKAYEIYMGAVVSYVADQNKHKAAWMAMHRPNPLLSLLLDDCIEFGRDRAHAGLKSLGDEGKKYVIDGDFEEIRKGRGVRYHNVTVLSLGFANAADSLSAIDEYVFKQKKYTIEQVVEAVKNNYEGSDLNVQIYNDFRKAPKYADGSDIGDKNAQFVLDALADACEREYIGNMKYVPTCHTIDANILFGSCCYASMDSRKDGEAFGKNAGGVMSVLKNSPTDLMVSASTLPQHRFSGGVPIDIYIEGSLLKTKESRDKIRELIKTYFDMGGMQVQVNSVDVDLLKKAYAEPEKYNHVIVRKGGFSMYFTDMPKLTQKDMIERLERESE